MKVLRNIFLIFVAIISITLVSLCLLYNHFTSPVDSNSTALIEVEIKNGSSLSEIGKVLEEKGVIHSQKFFLIYVKLHKQNNLKASVYELKKSMTLEEIIEVLKKGNNYNPDEIQVKFPEGANMRRVATVIKDNTNNTYEEVMNKLKDEEYIDSLIDKYWFLTDEIKNKDIYYPLEGYLFPDTYNFANKDVSIEKIFEVMLNKMGEELEPYKDEIEKRGLTIHEFLSLAAMVELEGIADDDRANIASVFYNRLDKKMSLGSDVTTCYAQMFDDLTLCHQTADFNLESPYNTRDVFKIGLPVGPVAAVSKSSIKASAMAPETDYLYFVANKYQKVYFTKTLAEHNQMILELKNKGEWLN